MLTESQSRTAHHSTRLQTRSLYITITQRLLLLGCRPVSYSHSQAHPPLFLVGQLPASLPATQFPQPHRELSVPFSLRTLSCTVTHFLSLTSAFQRTVLSCDPNQSSTFPLLHASQRSTPQLPTHSPLRATASIAKSSRFCCLFCNLQTKIPIPASQSLP
jgi:hypothetical protein